MFKFASAALFAAAFAMPAAAANTTVFSTDFDGAPTVYGGVGYTPFAGGAALQGMNSLGGFSGNAVVNKSGGNPASLSTLTLNNLPTHTSISLDFLLGFVNSWDGTGTGAFEGDYLDILVDGNVVATLSVNNYNFDATPPVLAGGTEITHGDLDNVSGYGFNNDRIVDMSSAPALTFAHTSSTLTLGLQAHGNGWQGGDDEYWAVDNLSVTADLTAAGVPEPATWALLLGGFGLAGGALRTRRRTTVLA